MLIQLEYIHTFEGRMVPDGTGQFDYEYSIKDHLGNTRVMFDEGGNVLQDISYYAFGMTMDGLSYVASSNNQENNYLYNGKELQTDLDLDWYDYGFRMYDATIGRWHAPDAMAVFFPDVSPYQYVHNNPINLVDHFGLYDDDRDEGQDDEHEAEGEGELSIGVVDYPPKRDDPKGGIDWGGVWDFFFGGARGPYTPGQDNEDARNAGYEKDWDEGYSERDGERDNDIGFSRRDQLQLGLRYYGGDYSGSLNDNIYFFVDQLNQFNPVAVLMDVAYSKRFGTDRFGNPMASFEADVEVASFLFFGGVKVGKKVFHKQIKKIILKNSGNYRKVVGNNPNIVIKNGKIILEGQGPYKGKSFETGLDFLDYFK